ncbi:hypothetical protein [Methylobacterium phyllostachyos]|nr:hypothetical protein [Methylobacterium phyllostachyos]
MIEPRSASAGRGFLFSVLGKRLFGCVLRRTPHLADARYLRGMTLKPLSYLMIGAFVSGLVMTVVGAVGVLTGS